MKESKKCYRCGEAFHKNLMKKCAAIHAKCSSCSKDGRFSKVCQRKKVDSIALDSDSEDDDADEEAHDTFVMNIVWQIKAKTHNPRW